jgi:hypothetical protein
MLRRVVLVRTGVSGEPSASSIRVTRIGELGTTIAVTSNRRTLWRRYFPPKRRLLKEPHDVISQRTALLMVTLHPPRSLYNTRIVSVYTGLTNQLTN